jgi:hypothetical protein
MQGDFRASRVLVLNDSTNMTTYLYNTLNTKYMNDLRMEMDGILHQRLQAMDLNMNMVDAVMLIAMLVELMTMKVGIFNLQVNKRGMYYLIAKGFFVNYTLLFQSCQFQWL